MPAGLDWKTVALIAAGAILLLTLVNSGAKKASGALRDRRRRKIQARRSEAEARAKARYERDLARIRAQFA